MRKTVEVQMDAGMEARPIALMVQTANQFSSHLYLEMDGKHVNAKSIMGMMSLVLTGFPANARICRSCSGSILLLAWRTPPSAGLFVSL